MPIFDNLEAKVITRAQSNVEDRIKAFTALPSDAKDTIMSGKGELMAKKPVQAALTVVDNAGSGAIKFVKKQVEITRRWSPI